MLTTLQRTLFLRRELTLGEQSWPCRNGESNPRECLHNFFTCRVSMQRWYRMFGLVVQVDWCCTQLFHALSLDWFGGCIAHKTMRLVQPLVESKSLFSVTWVRKHVSNALVSALRSTSWATSPLNIEPWLWLRETLADECQFASTLSPLWLSTVQQHCLDAKDASYYNHLPAYADRQYPFYKYTSVVLEDVCFNSIQG